MFKTKRVTLVGALALLLVIALFALSAACKKDKKDAGETPAADQTPAAEETRAPSDGDGDGDGSSADLEELFGAWAETEGMLTYEYTSTGGGTTDSGTFTLFWMPPDWRYDSVDDTGAQTTIISKGDDYYICGDGACLSYGGLGEIPPPVPFFGLFTDPSALGTTFAGAFGADLDTYDENIAGIDARCFSAATDTGDESGGGEWCWSEDGGLLLRVRAVTTLAGAESSYEFEATEVGSVSASDLEPPFPVEEIEIPTIEIPTQ
jgi:hypothetical protein